LFNGLDVHTESIAVSVAPSDSTEVRRYGLIGGTHDDVLRLAKKLQAAHPGSQLRFCYEAGPHGYPLARCLQAHGYVCILVAPSKVPRQPGDRVKINDSKVSHTARHRGWSARRASAPPRRWNGKHGAGLAPARGRVKTPRRAGMSEEKHPRLRVTRW
jgi:hypothetical protein